MSHALIICDAKKATAFYTEFLTKEGFSEIVLCTNGPEARRRMIDKVYDLIIVNMPLLVESAEEVAIDLAEKNQSQVLLFVKAEYAEETAAAVETFGIITVEKPVHSREFSAALRFSRIAQKRVALAQHENKKLQSKLNEVRFVSQAKLLLMQYEALSEEEAHRKIERRAMDERRPRIVVAKEIIDLYE